MRERELETVVLQRDVAAHGLKRGDLATVVFSYESGAIEAEFVRMSGNTQAVLTLEPGDFRPGSDEDLLAVRSIARE